ncbi:MAG TPA: hypothetical protein VM409_00995, partial [Chloroflexia bacterium]|nr:hypothetical protein [Chloroflexia bacterium]
WSAEKVRAHISALSGTHFDPLVVDAFLDIDQTSLPTGPLVSFTLFQDDEESPTAQGEATMPATAGARQI